MCLRTVALGWALLALGGCPLTIEPAESVVGRPCQQNTDCRGATLCITSFPAGYCSLPCAGAACPEGSRCVSIEFFGLTEQSCFRACADHHDCNRQGYACMVSPDAQGKVCGPAQPR